MGIFGIGKDYIWGSVDHRIPCFWGGERNFWFYSRIPLFGFKKKLGSLVLHMLRKMAISSLISFPVPSPLLAVSKYCTRLI